MERQKNCKGRFVIMREMDLWLCLVCSINGSRKAIFRHCPLDIPVTIGDAEEDEPRSLDVSWEFWHLRT